MTRSRNERAGCVRQIAVELGHAGAPVHGDQPERRRHREFGLVHGDGIGDRAEHVERGLMHMRGDAGDVGRSQVVCLDDLEQRVGRRVGVAARGVELERGFQQRPAHAQTVDKFCRIGVARHAGGHALRALQDAPGAGEAIARQEGGRQPVAGRLGGVQLLGIGGVAQELPQPGGLRPGRADGIEHRRRNRARAAAPWRRRRQSCRRCRSCGRRGNASGQGIRRCGCRPRSRRPMRR